MEISGRLKLSHQATQFPPHFSSFKYSTFGPRIPLDIVTMNMNAPGFLHRDVPAPVRIAQVGAITGAALATGEYILHTYIHTYGVHTEYIPVHTVQHIHYRAGQDYTGPYIYLAMDLADSLLNHTGIISGIAFHAVPSFLLSPASVTPHMYPSDTQHHVYICTPPYHLSWA